MESARKEGIPLGRIFTEEEALENRRDKRKGVLSNEFVFSQLLLAEEDLLESPRKKRAHVESLDNSLRALEEMRLAFKCTITGTVSVSSKKKLRLAEWQKGKDFQLLGSRIGKNLGEFVESESEEEEEDIPCETLCDSSTTQEFEKTVSKDSMSEKISIETKESKEVEEKEEEEEESENLYGSNLYAEDREGEEKGGTEKYRNSNYQQEEESEEIVEKTGGGFYAEDPDSEEKEEQVVKEQVDSEEVSSEPSDVASKVEQMISTASKAFKPPRKSLNYILDAEGSDLEIKIQSMYHSDSEEEEEARGEKGGKREVDDLSEEKSSEKNDSEEKVVSEEKSSKSSEVVRRARGGAQIYRYREANSRASYLTSISSLNFDSFVPKKNSRTIGYHLSRKVGRATEGIPNSNTLNSLTNFRKDLTFSLLVTPSSGRVHATRRPKREVAPLKKSEERSQDEFNAIFQEALSNLQVFDDEGNVSSSIEDHTKLIRLSTDFVSSARRYGRIIISEVYQPVNKKTIKPINLGGVIGGEKYVVRNILFKFAVDSSNVFGGNDAYAAKVAGRKLAHLFPS